MDENNNKDINDVDTSQNQQQNNTVNTNLTSQNTAVAEQPAVQQPNTEQAKQDKPKLKWFKSKLLIAVAAILAVSVLGAFAYYQSASDTPENRIKLALAEVIEAGAIQTEIEYIADNQPAGSGELTYQSNPAALSVSAQSTMADNEFDVDVRFVSDILYFKINQFDGLGEQFFGGEADFSSELTQNWIKLSPSTLSEFGVEEADNLDVKELSQSDKDKLTDIFRDSKIFVIKEELGSKVVDGVTTDGFHVDIDKDGLIKMLDEIEAANLDIVQDDKAKFAEQIAEAKESLRQENNEEIPDGNILLWLNGNSLKQLEFKGTNDMAGNSATVTVTALGGEVPAIEAPAESTDIGELLQQLFSTESSGLFETNFEDF